MGRMNSMNPLQARAAELIKDFHCAADEPGIRPAVPLSLARTEEALQVLSGAWYQLAADADPSEIDGLSREQEVRLIATLHDVAAAFARCARACREGRLAVTPVLTTRGGRSVA
jgi:hypothetical protein